MPGAHRDRARRVPTAPGGGRPQVRLRRRVAEPGEVPEPHPEPGRGGGQDRPHHGRRARQQRQGRGGGHHLPAAPRLQVLLAAVRRDLPLHHADGMPGRANAAGARRPDAAALRGPPEGPVRVLLAPPPRPVRADGQRQPARDHPRRGADAAAGVHRAHHHRQLPRVPSRIVRRPGEGGAAVDLRARAGHPRQELPARHGHREAAGRAGGLAVQVLVRGRPAGRGGAAEGRVPQGHRGPQVHRQQRPEEADPGREAADHAGEARAPRGGRVRHRRSAEGVPEADRRHDGGGEAGPGRSAGVRVGHLHAGHGVPQVLPQDLQRLGGRLQPRPGRGRRGVLDQRVLRHHDRRRRQPDHRARRHERGGRHRVSAAHHQHAVGRCQVRHRERRDRGARQLREPARPVRAAGGRAHPVLAQHGVQAQRRGPAALHRDHDALLHPVIAGAGQALAAAGHRVPDADHEGDRGILRDDVAHGIEDHRRGGQVLGPVARPHRRGIREGGRHPD
mmetsp:Transcript_11720/g.33795  ORF Transcript_11720/g.33795 Transcript_11720/m.33795 type:complete len:504 (+) Transcript_11720:3447-4958(+)